MRVPPSSAADTTDNGTGPTVIRAKDELHADRCAVSAQLEGVVLGRVRQFAREPQLVDESVVNVSGSHTVRIAPAQ
jgi:hypothetical protein